jgi:hypothetical protein
MQPVLGRPFASFSIEYGSGLGFFLGRPRGRFVVTGEVDSVSRGDAESRAGGVDIDSESDSIQPDEAHGSEGGLLALTPLSPTDDWTSVVGLECSSW